MRRSVVVLLLLALAVALPAGCGGQSASSLVTDQAAAPEARTAGSSMPSYPILLVDLPRLETGQPVRPAYSYPYRPSDRDYDSPSVSAQRPVGRRPGGEVDVSLVP